jgi:hypothetical protein
MPLRRYVALSVATGLVSVILTLGLVEALARLAGYGPWAPVFGAASEPIVYEPDPVLGWRPKPGSYVFRGYTKRALSILMTFWVDLDDLLAGPLARDGVLPQPTPLPRSARG